MARKKAILTTFLIHSAAFLLLSCASKPYCYNEDPKEQAYCEKGLKRSEELQKQWNEKRQRDSLEERIRFIRRDERL